LEEKRYGLQLYREMASEGPNRYELSPPSSAQFRPVWRASKSDPGILDGVSGFFSFQSLHEFGEASP